MLLKNRTMKRILINESQLDYIRENISHVKNNNIEIFKKEVRFFIYNLMTDNIGDTSDYWRINGVKKKQLFNKLKAYGIIEIDDNEKIMTPKRNFDRKLMRLYHEIFPEDEPGLIISEDDGGDAGISMGGTTSTNSGSYETPLNHTPIKRNFKKY